MQCCHVSESFLCNRMTLCWDLHHYQGGAKEVVVSVKLKGLEVALLAQFLQNQVRYEVALVADTGEFSK